MAQLAKKPCKGDWGFEGDWVKRHEEQFAELKAEALKVDPSKSLVGALVSFPFADGQAYYRVAKDKPLVLEHVPVFDAWMVDYAHIRGLRRADIVQIVKDDKKLAELFSS